MPNLMVALPNIGGALCSTPQSLAGAHYLMPCSNAAKTQYPLKFVGVPQTPEPISAVSGPTFAILSGYIEEYCCLTRFFLSSANYIMLTSLDKYFSTTTFSGWILDGILSHAWQSVHAVLEHADLFLKTYFTRYGSNAFKVWWDLLLSLYCKFIAESNSEIILKIG